MMASSQTAQIKKLQDQVDDIQNRLNLGGPPRLVAAKRGTLGTAANVDRETIEDGELQNGVVSGHFLDLNTTDAQTAADRCPAGYVVAKHPNDRGSN